MAHPSTPNRIRRSNACDLPQWWREGVREAMPLTPESMYSVVRIIGDWEEERTAIGTGFCIYVRSEAHPNVRYGYILTAHHVVVGQEDIELEMINPCQEGTLYPPLPLTKWCQPIAGLDLALAPIRPRPSHPIQALEFGHHLIPNLEVPLGAKFYYVGLLAPLDRSMARSGTIGAIDQTEVDHEGDYDYPVHLADCRSYGGFSGSPCFVEIPYVNLGPASLPAALKISSSEMPPQLGSIIYLHLLCGMFTEHLNGRNAGRMVSRAGVGFILRSNEIAEALMTEDMQAERELWDTEKRIDDKDIYEEDRPRHVSATADEFDSFQALTKKVIQVPKSEIDEKRKK